MPEYLGYVFWHWPRLGTVRRTYERKLTAFQDSLRAHAPDGLTEALSFRVRAVPWAPPRSQVYEDWYLVRDFGSLGVLNDAAVAKPNKEPHDEVAGDATVGAGGVYKLRRGGLDLRDARFETWMRKPAGTSYEAFYDRLSKLVSDRDTDLWRRQMVLGPAPEFCLHSESSPDLPKQFHPRSVRVQVVGRRLAESKRKEE